MDTNDEKKLTNTTDDGYDIEEYYDETADEKYFKKAKPASLFEKYMKSKNSFVYTCLIIAILLMFLFGPFFKVTEITVTGNAMLSREEILNISGLNLGVNILLSDVNRAESKIAKIPAIDGVKVKRISPSRISIAVIECKEVGIIKYLGNYITVSSEGEILEISNKKPKKKLPEMLNLTLGQTNVGQTVIIPDKTVEKAVYKYFETFENLKVLGEIKKIDFKKIDDVSLTLSNDILVKVGHADKIPYKFAYLEKIFAELSGQRGGILDISDPDTSVVYKAS